MSSNQIVPNYSKERSNKIISGMNQSKSGSYDNKLIKSQSKNSRHLKT